MPRARDSQFPVLTHLKELAQEADQYVADFPAESAVDAWFDTVKETFIKIRDCTKVTVFDYPPALSSIYGHDRTKRNINKVSENQVTHIHANKQPASGKNNAVDDRKNRTEIDSKDPHNSPLQSKNEVEAVPKKDEVHQNKSQFHISSSSKGVLQANTPCSPKAKAPYTPKGKTLQAHKTPCTPKAKTPYTPKVLLPLKTSLLQNCITSSSEKLQTPVDRTFVRSINASSILLSSKSTNSATSSKGIDSYSTIKTRSSLKRKSSVSKEESNKKQKTKVTKDISSCKTMYPKRQVEKQPLMKTITMGSENKAKVLVSVIPSLQVKNIPVISKEKQILEEIKKKEEKAIENRKRVLEERKMKAEENKKKREENREKTALKRLQMEKEKEEKREIENKKSQVIRETIKKAGMKSRVKELIEQSTKESKSGPLTSSKQNEMNGDVFKSPAPNKSFDSENYELTPGPDSSTYDFSEGEDDRPAGKHIPLWAQGAYIKSALIQQFYNPLDTDDIFGHVIDAPDLAEIFCIQKKRYKIRTSSAIWNTPPDRSLRH